MRPISLAVDVTNYVMLELGQPLHAYDRDRLHGADRGAPGRSGASSSTTLDGVERTLDAEDLLIADDSGPIGLAGVMGGATTEIPTQTGEPPVDRDRRGRALRPGRRSPAPARRHKLPSEASKRFERGVDPEAAGAAAQRAVDLLV